MASSLSLVGVIWTILTLCSTLIASVGFFMPYWLVAGDVTLLPSNALPSNDDAIGGQTSSFGTFRRCGYSHVTSGEAGVQVLV